MAILRYSNLSGMLTGLPKALRFEDGNLLNLDGIINENIQEEAHIWVILKGLILNFFLFIHLNMTR